MSDNLIKFKTEFDIHASTHPDMQITTREACMRLRRVPTNQKYSSPTIFKI